MTIHDLYCHSVKGALNDSEIRKWLIPKLSNQAVKPKAVIEELRVHNGCAIADVVTLHTEAHCYEIKGEGDKIERIKVQGKFYDTSFRKITLVTTANHLKKALELAPLHWGIVEAYRESERVLFRHIRAVKSNSLFDKEIATLTLWKSEMLSLVEGSVNKANPRGQLANLISSQKRKAELSSQISEALVGRYESIGT